MFVIQNAATETFCAMRAVGSSEETACAVYAALYNAQLSSRLVDGVYTNSDNGIVYETLLCHEWRNFEELAEHMREVHEVTLTASLD